MAWNRHDHFTGHVRTVIRPPSACRKPIQITPPGRLCRPPALAWFVNREQTVSRGDGSAIAGIGMDSRMLVTLAMTSVGALTIAMDTCVGLYGWPAHRWQHDV